MDTVRLAIGGGIIGVSLAGLACAAFGAQLPVVGQAIVAGSALIGGLGYLVGEGLWLAMRDAAQDIRKS